VADEIRVPVASDADIVTARQRGRDLAASIGLAPTDLTLIATAISEVARNIYRYAGTGEIILRIVSHGQRRGVLVIAKDSGPGIADVELAMRDGYSTTASSGLGLPGARRLMDEFQIVSRRNVGTTVTMTKWGRSNG
jgi:serine/threonine-protein kinase RsbT